MEKVGWNVGHAFSKERLRNKLILRPLTAAGLQRTIRLPHCTELQPSPSFAPRTLAPPRIYCFRFGPAYPISKLLKLFKLSSQHLKTKT